MSALSLPAIDPPRRSIVGGVAARAIVVALVAVALLYCVTYEALSSASRRALSAAVDTDIAGLADIHSSGGDAELIARIGDRLALTGLDQRPAHYLLADARHRPIAGDLHQWPALSDATSEAGFVTLEGGRPAFARATRLSPRLSLVVARDYTGDRALLQRLALLFGAVGAAIAAMVGLLAWHSSRRLAVRVDRINAAYRDAADAAAAAALLADAGRDEIGELARHSGAALERLARLVEAHRHVSDNVAHEIRTPLMHLDGRLLGLLKRDPGEDAAAILARARADIRRIVAMLDSLLDIAAHEARRGDPSGLAPLDLSALLLDIVAIYSSSIEEAGIGLETAIAPDVQIAGDAMQLTRLVSNLLDNAIKYVPAGGRIRVSLAPDGVVRVSDDGPGIAPEARPHIFDRFRRIEGGDPDRPVGHGLGLALARAIAERHGLTLRLEDGDKGCSFVIAPDREKG